MLDKEAYNNKTKLIMKNKGKYTMKLINKKELK